MEEYFDVCDENGNPTGVIASRADAHREGLCHRTSHIWVIRNASFGFAEILMQKRSEEKDSFPGCYDTSSAGHVMAGDNPLDSALRELSEELGINASRDELKYIGYFRNKYESEFHGKVFRDNEISNVYVYDGTVDEKNLVLQKSEVSAVEWFDINYVYSEKRKHNKKFCVPVAGLDVLMTYLNSIG